MFATASHSSGHRALHRLRRTFQQPTLRSVVPPLVATRKPTICVRPSSSSTSKTTVASDESKLFYDTPSFVQVGDPDTPDTGTFNCDEEPHMLSYKLGYGYYPISLGQKLNEGKLEIVRKLGWGEDSSTWLARVIDDTSATRYVAVEVLTVFKTLCVQLGISAALDSFKRVTSANVNHPGYNNCIHLREHFETKSNHGPHLCFVTDVFGPGLSVFRKSLPNKTLPVPLVKRTIKQILFSLHYLHSHCGMIHADLTPENTLIHLAGGDEAITRFLENNPSIMYEPRLEPELSPDPIITVVSQPLTNFAHKLDMSNFSVSLCGFGDSIHIDKLPIDRKVQAVLLRAPEVILGHPWSTPIDIWSMGCLVFDYLVSDCLFKLHESPPVSFDDVHLQRIIEHVGSFPPNFLAACGSRARFFDEQGSLLRIKDFSSLPMNEALRRYKCVDEKDIPSAAAFIRRCLTIDPAARPSALELLDGEWLKDA